MLLNEYITLLNILNLTFNPHFYRFMYFAIQNYYFASLFILFKGLFICQCCYFALLKIIYKINYQMFFTLAPPNFYFKILFR